MTLALEYLGVMVVMTGAVWASTEGLGTIFHTKKGLIALILGPLAGVCAHGSGFLPVPDNAKAGWAWAFAALMGLVCTLGARAFNDYAFNPLKKKLGG